MCEAFAHGYKPICDRMHIVSIIVTGIAINADGTREFFSVKLEFQCDAGLLAECGFPSGRLRYNAARNIVSFVK